MHRNLGWVFAGLAFLALLTVAFPAFAKVFTPEELMGERAIAPPTCKDGLCTMKESDLEFIFQRGQLMEAVANRLMDRLNSCRGGHTT